MKSAGTVVNSFIYSHKMVQIFKMPMGAVGMEKKKDGKGMLAKPTGAISILHVLG